MSTKYSHVQLGIVDASGNLNVLYPVNTAKDVSLIRTNTKIPSTVSTMQQFADVMGDLAFKNKNDLNIAYLDMTEVTDL